MNLYSDFLNRFTQYQNDAVKHGEAWSEPDIEFMIYTAGALMRLVLQLEDAGEVT